MSPADLLLDPADANAYDNYAEALAVNGRRDEAILRFRRALELNPGNEAAQAALRRLEAANRPSAP